MGKPRPTSPGAVERSKETALHHRSHSTHTLLGCRRVSCTGAPSFQDVPCGFIPSRPTFEALVKKRDTPRLTTPSLSSEETTLNNSAFTFSAGFATGSHESLQISQCSLVLAALSAPERTGLGTVASCAKKLQIFLMYPGRMVINWMSAIFNICFKLFSTMISLPEMRVCSAQLVLWS